MLERGSIERVAKLNDRMLHAHGVCVVHLRSFPCSARSQAIALFQRIWGVGPTKAEELVQRGFLSIEQLRKDPSCLNARQQLCLSLFEDLSTRIPREEVTAIAAVVSVLGPLGSACLLVILSCVLLFLTPSFTQGDSQTRSYFRSKKPWIGL